MSPPLSIPPPLPVLLLLSLLLLLLLPLPLWPPLGRASSSTGVPVAPPGTRAGNTGGARSGRTYRRGALVTAVEAGEDSAAVAAVAAAEAAAGEACELYFYAVFKTPRTDHLQIMIP